MALAIPEFALEEARRRGPLPFGPGIDRVNPRVTRGALRSPVPGQISAGGLPTPVGPRFGGGGRRLAAPPPLAGGLPTPVGPRFGGGGFRSPFQGTIQELLARGLPTPGGELPGQVTAGGLPTPRRRPVRDARADVKQARRGVRAARKVRRRAFRAGGSTIGQQADVIRAKAARKDARRTLDRQRATRKIRRLLKR